MSGGLTDKTVSRLTGHKNPGMIAHYNRPGEEQFQREMEKCPTLRLVS